MERTDYPALGLAVYKTVLPNGLAIYAAPRPGWRRAQAFFVTNYGGADRRFSLNTTVYDTPAGMAHFLEHKMFDMPSGSVDDAFARRGADADAYTSEAVTNYHARCTDRFGENLRDLLAFVSTPYFTPETVAKERGIIGQEIAESEDDPVFAAYMGCMKLLFGEGPLGDSIVGTAASIGDITPETLAICHKAFYAPANMVLCAAGDIDPAEVERIAREVLPGESGPLPERDYGPDTGLMPLETRAERAMDVSAPQFCAGVKLGPAAAEPEALKARLTAELAMRCLWGGHAPAYLELYEKGLLNDAFRYEPTYAAGVGYVCLEGESPDPEAALAGLLGAVERDMDPAFFARQKKAMQGGFIRMLDDFYDLADALAEGHFAGFDPLTAPEVLEELTCAEVTAWAREHFAPARFAMAVIRPKEA